MMWTKVITVNAAMKAIDDTACGSVIPKWPNQGANWWARNGSPIQPKPRLASVTPSWDAESIAPKCPVARRASFTLQPPFFARGLSWLARTFTKANSVATKNPLARIKTTIVTASNVLPNRSSMSLTESKPRPIVRKSFGQKERLTRSGQGTSRLRLFLSRFSKALGFGVIELSLPARDNHTGEAIAEHIHRSPRHIEQRIDA